MTRPALIYVRILQWFVVVNPLMKPYNLYAEYAFKAWLSTDIACEQALSEDPVFHGVTLSLDTILVD